MAVTLMGGPVHKDTQSSELLRIQDESRNTEYWL